MEWGMRRADELGLESYIEATAAGRLLYERCGYRSVARVDVDMEDKDGEKGEVWKALQSDLLPAGYDSMWRPVKGIWMKDEPQKTWGRRLAGMTDS